jgi:diguanylate cyclase (GGDEF)-like protein
MQKDEFERLAELHGLGILDTEIEADFDILTRLAAYLTDSQYAFISLIDQNRVWQKSGFGAAPEVHACDKAICSLALSVEKILQIEDINNDPRTLMRPQCIRGQSIRSYVGANLITSSGHSIGTLCVMDTKSRTHEKEVLDLMCGLADQTIKLIELRHTKKTLTQDVAYLKDLANTDALTGALNRRSFMRFVEREHAKAIKTNLGYSICMIDIDFFKTINDRFGHPFGDRVLKVFVQILKNELREVDKIARFGGDEFCIIFPGIDQQLALTAMNRIRSAFELFAQSIQEIEVPLTFSAGISDTFGKRHSVGEVLQRADKTLYLSKKFGRNQVKIEVSNE